MTTAAIVMRFCYDPGYDEQAFAWRLAWLRDRVLPRIVAQEDARFELWVWVHPRHEAIVQALHPMVRTFTVRANAVAIEGRHPWSTVNGLPRFEVQLRLDSDDLIGPRYVRSTLDALAKITAPRAIVWHQPLKFDVNTGAVYWCAPAAGMGRYTARKLSAFMALRQPVAANRYDWVYSLGHTRLGALADEFGKLPEGQCWAACHAHNDSTQVYSYDKAIGQIEI